jgi:hypothetical protein
MKRGKRGHSIHSSSLVTMASTHEIVADRLRARNVPIVFATGYSAPHLRNGGTVIEKPYTQEKLAEALRAIFRPMACSFVAIAFCCNQRGRRPPT